MQRDSIWTIGYEGATPEELIAALQHAKIDVLADTRASHKRVAKGFSAKELTAACDMAGIEYIHYPALGMPSAGRALAREGNYDEAWEMYEAEIGHKKPAKQIVELREMSRARRVCLMCMERNHEHCHRHILARVIGLGHSSLQAFHTYNLTPESPDLLEEIEA